MVRRFGLEGILSMTHSTRAVLLAVALSACVAAPAYGQTAADPSPTPAQTTTTPAETTTTPTQTTPTQTTPTETAPPPEIDGPTSAPNEYVESVPTGGGQTPASKVKGTVAPAPPAPAPAPATPAAPTDTTPSSETPSAPTRERANRKKHSRPHREREPQRAAKPVETTPPRVSSAPAATTTVAGEPANPLLLGLALIAITAGVLSTAVLRRQGAGT